MAADLAVVKHLGFAPLVDARPVVQHIDTVLRPAGLGLRRIAELADVPWVTLHRLYAGEPARRRGPNRHVSLRTARRVLAIPGDPLIAADKALVPALGSRRRIQAMAADGWSITWQETEAGARRGAIAEVLLREHITARTARTVAALYARLSDTPPPQNTAQQRGSVLRTRRLAESRSWPRSIDWDNDDLDSSDGRPATGEPDAPGRHAGAADPDEFDFLVSLGESRHQAAKAVGASLASIERARQRRAAV